MLIVAALTFVLIVIGILIVSFASKSDIPKDAKIEVELVPFAMHGLNVRSRVDEDTWSQIARKAHYLNAIAFNMKRGKCEVCRGNGKRQGFKHSLEAHEEWDFDFNTGTQKLTRIRSLCPLCHKAVHIGFADKQGYGNQVRAHMKKVNRWDFNQVESHIKLAKKNVMALNKKGVFKIDLTYLNRRDYQNIHHVVFTENETANCQKG